MMGLPNTAVQPNRVPWRRNKLCKINKLEPATRDNLDLSEFGYREHMTRLPRQVKDLSVPHMDFKRGTTESNQSKLGNKSVT
jgi:hypothetical protein